MTDNNFKVSFHCGQHYVLLHSYVKRRPARNRSKAAAQMRSMS